MSKIEEYIFSDIEITGVMGAANDEIAIDTGKKLIYMRKEDVIAMAEHFGLVVIPVEPDISKLQKCGFGDCGNTLKDDYLAIIKVAGEGGW
jgi:hypothetical protein